MTHHHGMLGFVGPMPCRMSLLRSAATAKDGDLKIMKTCLCGFWHIVLLSSTSSRNPALKRPSSCECVSCLARSFFGPASTLRISMRTRSSLRFPVSSGLIWAPIGEHVCHPLGVDENISQCWKLVPVWPPWRSCSGNYAIITDDGFFSPIALPQSWVRAKVARRGRACAELSDRSAPWPSALASS